MRNYIIFGIGFSGQLLFGARMLIQWIQSEKEKTVVSSQLFWKTSLVASAVLLIYGVLRHDAIIIVGQIISYFIYIRNLQLIGEWKSFSVYAKITFSILPLAILLLLINSGIFNSALFVHRNSVTHPLIIIGWIGQFLLNVRFVYQLYYAEKAHQAILPLGFWFISLSGSILVVAYALFRLDPVLLVAQILGMLVYFRNIVLERRTRKILTLK